MAITLLPAVPQRTDDPTTYVSKADTFIAALPQFVTDANALAGNLNSIAAGGAFATPYKFAASTGPVGTVTGGWLSFDNSLNAQTTTRLWVDHHTSAGDMYDSAYTAFTNSGSTIKGHVRLVKQGDPTRWAIFALTTYSRVDATYGMWYVTPVAQSHAAPFVANDAIIMYFQRTGDIGTAGTLVRRLGTWAVTTGAAQTIVANVSNTDLLVVTAADTMTLGVPSGTPVDGQSLMFRIKDNGTARTISYNTIFRASVELPFPSTTTVGKWVYLGFVYNATDAKWDLVAAINAM